MGRLVGLARLANRTGKTTPDLARLARLASLGCASPSSMQVTRPERGGWVWVRLYKVGNRPVQFPLLKQYGLFWG